MENIENTFSENTGERPLSRERQDEIRSKFDAILDRITSNFGDPNNLSEQDYNTFIGFIKLFNEMMGQINAGDYQKETFSSLLDKLMKNSIGCQSIDEVYFFVSLLKEEGIGIDEQNLVLKLKEFINRHPEFKESESESDTLPYRFPIIVTRKEGETSEQLDSYTITIGDHPYLASNYSKSVPSKINIKKEILLPLLVGLGVGASVAFFESKNNDGKPDEVGLDKKINQGDKQSSDSVAQISYGGLSGIPAYDSPEYNPFMLNKTRKVLERLQSFGASQIDKNKHDIVKKYLNELNEMLDSGVYNPSKLRSVRIGLRDSGLFDGNGGADVANILEEIFSME